MFDIEIHYKTGNSFGTHHEKSTLDFPVKKLETAKANLKRIKEHYKKYSEHKDYKKRGSLDLVLDDGETKKYSVFWVGYFETLLGAKIIPDDQSDMSFEI